MALFKKKQEPSGGVRQMTLQEAVARGIASFELRGVGEGVTSKVRIIVTKHVEEPLEILIPEGTEFVPILYEDTAERTPAGDGQTPASGEEAER